MKKLFYGEKHSFIEWTYVTEIYMLITLKHKKVAVEKFVKKLFYGEKHSFIEWTYVTEIKEAYFGIFTKQVSCPLVFLF